MMDMNIENIELVENLAVLSERMLHNNNRYLRKFEVDNNVDEL